MMDIDDLAGERDPALTTAPTAETQLQAAADRERIFAALEAMADALRIPLMLRDGDGLSYDEIAEQLGISLSAVKMRIKRAREEFRRRFATLMPGERLGSPPELA